MRIRHGTRDIEVDPVEIIKAEEPWCEYALEDGTRIKIKHVLGAIFRAREVYTESGEPLYITRSQNVVMAAEVPERLKKEA